MQLRFMKPFHHAKQKRHWEWRMDDHARVRSKREPSLPTVMKSVIHVFDTQSDIFGLNLSCRVSVYANASAKVLRVQPATLAYEKALEILRVPQPLK